MYEDGIIINFGEWKAISIFPDIEGLRQAIPYRLICSFYVLKVFICDQEDGISWNLEWNKIESEGISISHIFFADDGLLFT